MFYITKEFLILNVHCHANLSFLIWDSDTLILLIALKDVFPSSIYLNKNLLCNRDNIYTSQVCILHSTLHLSVLLFCFSWPAGFSRCPWQCGQHLTYAKKQTKHVSLSELILSLFQNTFLCKVYCFPVPNHLMYTLFRAWDWRLVVLGWAAAGVGKMSPTWWSTGGWFTTAASCVPSPLQRWS